jgi:hypothetical protein
MLLLFEDGGFSRGRLDLDQLNVSILCGEGQREAVRKSGENAMICSGGPQHDVCRFAVVVPEFCA